MARKQEPVGLALRLSAIERLYMVMGGANFYPFTAGEIADPRDRTLANRLVTTALRRHGQINLILAEALEKGLPKKSGSFESALRIATAQLVFLPDLGAHSALFLAVESIKRDKRAQHLTGLMNAVLRTVQQNSARYWSLPEIQLLPAAVATRWSELYGDDALAHFSTALIEGAPLDLTLKHADPELIAMLGAEPLFADSFRLLVRDRSVDALPGYDEGRWWVQDVASALPARLMGLPEGARILDLCAAPGGKSAQLIKAGYAVTALDSDESRLHRLRANLARLQYTAEIVAADATRYAPQTLFDGVLLDAPCSATGTFRRHPEVLWHRNQDGIANRVAGQRAMLANAIKCIKPGGILVYCVCSLEPEEGEDQIAWALDALPGLERLPVTGAEVPGLAEALSPVGELRTHPGTMLGDKVTGMDGFFVSRLTKSS